MDILWHFQILKHSLVSWEALHLTWKLARLGRYSCQVFLLVEGEDASPGVRQTWVIMGPRQALVRNYMTHRGGKRLGWEVREPSRYPASLYPALVPQLRGASPGPPPSQACT